MAPNLQIYVINEGLKLSLSVLWLVVNGLLFYFTFMFYYTGPQFYYLHQMLGYGLCISRASAACINLNCSALLLPMCKRLVTALRGANVINGHQFRRLLDKGRSFHIYCGYLLGLLAVVHCGAHAYNAAYFSKYYNKRYKELNVAKYADQNPLVMLVTTVAGITGLLLVFCLVTIIVFACRPMRKGRHDRFWKTHHLFVAFYVLLLLHGLDGVIKYQTNLTEHRPGCFVVISSSSNESSEPFVVAEPEPYPESNTPVSEAMDVKDPRPLRAPRMPPAKENSSLLTKPLTMPEPVHGYRQEDVGSKEIVVPEPLPEDFAQSLHHAENSSILKEETLSATNSFRPDHQVIMNGKWVTIRECHQPPPLFSSCSKESWMWICAPVLLYLAERFFRHFRTPTAAATVVGFREHAGDTFEVRLLQDNFKAKPGQYVWIRCPTVSRVESHPFTLTSVPCSSDPTCGIHVKAVGDWTRELRDTLVQRAEQFPAEDPSLYDYNEGPSSNRKDCINTSYLTNRIDCEKSGKSPVTHFHHAVQEQGRECLPDEDCISLYDNMLPETSCEKQRSFPPKVGNLKPVRKTCASGGLLVGSDSQVCPSVVSSRFPKLYIEGPAGSAMEDVFKFKVSVCFAGGIGITPFASVMHSLLKNDKLRSRMTLEQLHLVWACREKNHFLWFADLLNELQIKMHFEERCTFNVDLYCTGTARGGEDLERALSPCVTNSKLYCGRPEPDKILEKIAKISQRSTVGVFCCGPSSLISSVRKQCFHYTSTKKARFVFNKECF